MLSVILPARNEHYLQKTIDSLLNSAEGEIEILVILDGYWPDPPLKDDKRVIIIHRSEAKGMQNGVNSAVQIAKGEYIMKCDAHCLFAKGFDTVLKSNCEENWLAIPPRYSLDVEKWEPKTEKRLPVCYDFITFPYGNDDIYGSGIHGRKWIGDNMGFNSYYEKEIARKDILIDDVISIQGSCWFMHKSHFLNIDGQDEVHSSFYQEPQEMVFKTWLSGGRCVVNKNTWYAHWHKNKGSQYGFSINQKKDTEKFSSWCWMTNQWPKRIRDIKWLIDKFMPMPGWNNNWEEEVIQYYKDHIDLTTNFRIFDKDGNDGFKINGCN